MPGGRPPKPTSLKLLAGDHRKNPARINRQEPRPAVTALDAPAFLSPAARGIWDSLAPDLAAKGVLTAWDADALGRWCAAAARVREAERHLAKEGEVLKVPVFARSSGEQVATRRVTNPWMAVWTAASKEADALASQFGFTPAARAKLRVGEGGKEPAADYLTG